MNMLDEAMSLLRMAPVAVESRIDELTTEQRRELDDTLGKVAQCAAWLEGYVGSRYGHGGSDQGHDSAVKEANRRLKGVRKALGYSYPAAGYIHV